MGQNNPIAAERARVGMSQEKLAELLGVTSRTVKNYESGKEIPASKLKIMSTVFNVSTDYLLGLTNQPRPFGGQSA